MLFQIMHSLEEIPSINEKVKVTGCFPLIETVTELTCMDIGSLSCNAPAQITTEKKEGGGVEGSQMFFKEPHVWPTYPLFPHNTFTNISLPLWPAITLFHHILLLLLLYFLFFIFYLFFSHNTNTSLSHSLTPTSTFTSHHLHHLFPARLPENSIGKR